MDQEWDEDEFHAVAMMRIRYLQTLMAYIHEEWDNVPEQMTPRHAMFLNGCCDQNLTIPTAAGLFAEKFLKKVNQ